MAEVTEYPKLVYLQAGGSVRVATAADEARVRGEDGQTQTPNPDVAPAVTRRRRRAEEV